MGLDTVSEIDVAREAREAELAELEAAQIAEAEADQVHSHEGERESIEDIAHEQEDLADFKLEAGEPVGPMPPKTLSSIELPPEEIRVAGTVQLSKFKVAGKRPTSSSLKIMGGKIPILDDGAFSKGETVEVSGLVRITGEGAYDVGDKSTHAAVSCERRHVGKWIDMKVSAVRSDDDPEIVSIAPDELESLNNGMSVRIGGGLELRVN